MLIHWVSVGLGCSLFIAGNSMALRAADPGRGAARSPGLPDTTRPAGADGEVVGDAPARIQGIPLRDPKADAKLTDLTSFYMLALTEDASGAYGYTLAKLPQGIQKLGNVEYDLRGVVQVSSQQFVLANRAFPVEVKGIKVAQKFHMLRFLHASRWTEPNGATIGKYVIHYADGQIKEVPFRFGLELRDWRPMHDPEPKLDGPVAAWRGQDDRGLETLLWERRRRVRRHSGRPEKHPRKWACCEPGLA
jgi:hypothetical protein